MLFFQVHWIFQRGDAIPPPERPCKVFLRHSTCVYTTVAKGDRLLGAGPAHRAGAPAPLHDVDVRPLTRPGAEPVVLPSYYSLVVDIDSLLLEIGIFPLKGLGPVEAFGFPIILFVSYKSTRSYLVLYLPDDQVPPLTIHRNDVHSNCSRSKTSIWQQKLLFFSCCSCTFK